MLVKNRMTRNPITVTPDVSISEAFSIMKEHTFRRLPVVQGGKLVGIVTERELEQVSPSKATTLSVFELNYLLEKTTIKEAMSREPITVQDDDLIEKAKANGNACSAVSCYETVVLTENRTSGKEQIDRNRIVRVQTPQCYNYGLIKSLYEKADKDNREDFVYANILAMNYGVEIYFSKGTNNNIKITTKDDIALFRALLYYINNAEGEEN